MKFNMQKKYHFDTRIKIKNSLPYTLPRSVATLPRFAPYNDI